MTLTLSAVLLFALASVVAVKTRASNAGAAVVLFLFGFFTAGTGAYGPIRDLVASFVRFLSQLG
ncbi:hypothetical protein OG866_14065 [Streptomyces sp. NBC_00663]|uniref:hypothetical protein n=1 Tax=Streptomyces sp. NBC_00663 TaxID=2975801 RepID=UPI002E2F04D6|nr:hypothetical protein [Streptomyces sp. NBC_00663]